MTVHENRSARPRSANERLKARAQPVFWASIIAATMLHFLAFALWPQMRVPAFSNGEMRAVEVVPDIERLARPDLPRPPGKIARPAVPVVAHLDLVAPEVTIAAVSFELFGEFEVPPPPVAADDALARFRTFIPLMVRPELKNRREVAKALNNRYNRYLRYRGTKGKLLVRFWIDEEGRTRKCELAESSGDAQLDNAAKEVAEMMRFSPALDHGRPVPVLVALPVVFTHE